MPRDSSASLGTELACSSHMDTCATCGEKLVQKQGRGRRKIRCPSCAAERALELRRKRCREYARRSRETDPKKAYQRARDWRLRNPDYDQRAHLRRFYGLTLEQFQAMETEQRGCCAICRKIPKERLHVDHCHESGRIRGLLCRACNSAIGYLGDDPELVDRAAAYLRSR